MIRSHLAQANRYIAGMKADIARERVILEHALGVGHPLEVAESRPEAREGRVRIFEKHPQLVLDQLKRPLPEEGDHPAAPPAGDLTGRPGFVGWVPADAQRAKESPGHRDRGF